mgnify:CR=1 FL=1
MVILLFCWPYLFNPYLWYSLDKKFFVWACTDVYRSVEVCRIALRCPFFHFSDTKPAFTFWCSRYSMISSTWYKTFDLVIRRYEMPFLRLIPAKVSRVIPKLWAPSSSVKVCSVITWYPVFSCFDSWLSIVSDPFIKLNYALTIVQMWHQFSFDI